MVALDLAQWAYTLFGPSYHMWFTLLLIAAAMAGYTSDKIPLELTSLSVISLLLLFFHLFPLTDGYGRALLDASHLLEGFANPALIAVMALLVIGQAVVRTGAMNDVANLILRLSYGNAIIAIGASFLVVTVVSAFLNNTPVVVIFIPILIAIARKVGVSVSRVMIPLSFAAILGGMTTLIGTSTNLLVAGEYNALGLGHIGFFDFMLPGSILAGVGLIYSLGIVPRILPDRASLAKALVHDGNRQFVAHIDIDTSSKIVGLRVNDEAFAKVKELSVKMVQRGEHAFLPPFDDTLVLKPGDTVIVSATRQAITDLLSEQPQMLLHQFPELTDGAEEEGKELKPAENIGMAEVVIAPASRMIGQNLEQIGFRYNHHCIVIGIQRGARVIRSKLTEVRLAAGDVLLLMGKHEDLLALRENRDLLLLEWTAEELPSRSYARKAIAIFAGVVSLSAMNVVPIHISAFAGASACILTGCLNIRQAMRALDSQIIFIVVAALGLSDALQATGGAALIANGIINLTYGAEPVAVMSVLFITMALFTNLLSNNASALLFTPIAINAAELLGANPMMFVYAVIFACNCSFATPIGYQTNLLVMGPGHYKFSDFLKAGIPLVLLMWASYTAYAYFCF